MRQVFGGNSQGFSTFDPRLDRDVFRIHAGGYCVAAGPAIISTLLGSCVAVCLRDPEGPVAAMNHFLLPWPDRVSADKQVEGDCRYGVYAMRAIVDGMERMGACRTRMQAKLFGGAEMLAGMQPVGRGNIGYAEEVLERLGIPVIARDVGGREHRVIRFFTENGRVQLQKPRARGVESVVARRHGGTEAALRGE
ncbi:chemotaxis protein CheD [Gammaproteobacteria bacterium AB-CW1]|uniref:Probable chemoreceptor glutamine deamidase CheD n=1 Tax=Natronospira elongata TaxID=3110268 RepID=A0AAP6JCL6_9GAMM|nr:chemotaxis protein CheD [Gammaproteobacteria bacterium AB-CW1]